MLLVFRDNSWIKPHDQQQAILSLIRAINNMVQLDLQQHGELKQ